MKLFIYVDENNLIKDILDKQENSTLTIIELDSKKLSKKEFSKFIDLKKLWENEFLFKENYQLIYQNNNATLQKVIWLSYNKNNEIIELSPKKNNNEYTWVLVPYNNDIKEFIDGTRSLLKYKIDSSTNPVTIIEKKDNDELIKIELLKNYKIKFVENDEDLYLEYNRKLKLLKIDPIKELMFNTIYITKKNDRTILYKTITINDRKNSFTIKNINLPKDFDLYPSDNVNILCKYKEIND